MLFVIRSSGYVDLGWTQKLVPVEVAFLNLCDHGIRFSLRGGDNSYSLVIRGIERLTLRCYLLHAFLGQQVL